MGQQGISPGGSFTARGADGIDRSFRYEVHEGLDRTTYAIYADPVPMGGHFFELTLVQEDGLGLRIDYIGHHDLREYVGKWIPDVILPLVATTRHQRIWSSRRFVDGRGEFRTAPVEAMWARLVENGCAGHDPLKGRYFVDPGSVPPAARV